MMVSQVLAVGPWLRSLTFVSLTSLVCKMGIRWSPYLQGDAEVCEFSDSEHQPGPGVWLDLETR